MNLSSVTSTIAAARSKLVELKTSIRRRLPQPVFTLFPVYAGLALVGLGMAVGRHEQTILNEILILGIFGMAYDVLFGYTGLLSFGHAAFFGAGAYTGIFLTNEFALPFLAIVGIAIVVGVVLSVVIGLISLGTTGVYFAMLTLALAQLLYILAQRLSEIGGASGLSVFERPETFLPLDLGDPFQFYVLTVVVLAGTYVLLRRLLSSPVGDVFRAIRENEDRAEMLGYSTFYYKLLALIVSGVFSSIAGVFFGLFLYLASPQFLFWTQSGDVLLQTLFGGMGTLVGPILGGVFIIYLEEILQPITDQWRLVVGVSFVLVVIFVPKGIAGIFSEED